MNGPARFVTAGIPEGISPEAWRKALAARIALHLNRIDNLIAALDAADADPDLEDTADDEPWLGWVEGGPRDIDYSNVDDREGDGSDDEYTLGWTDDESACGKLSAAGTGTVGGELEPTLGFVDHGMGWREGEGLDDAEENGDEGDFDGGEMDAPGFIAGGNEEGPASQSYGYAPTGPAMFDGSGHEVAHAALLNAGPRIEQYPVRTIGQKTTLLSNGEEMQTFVPYQSGYVLRSEATENDSPDMTDFSAYARERRGRPDRRNGRPG